jgi:hypothetical protein
MTIIVGAIAGLAGSLVFELFVNKQPVPTAPKPDPVMLHSSQINDAYEHAWHNGEAGVIGRPAAPRARLVLYKEWVSGGWQLCTSNCVPMRGSFIADPAPKATPVRLPSR